MEMDRHKHAMGWRENEAKCRAYSCAQPYFNLSSEPSSNQSTSGQEPLLLTFPIDELISKLRADLEASQEMVVRLEGTKEKWYWLTEYDRKGRKDWFMTVFKPTFMHKMVEMNQVASFVVKAEKQLSGMQDSRSTTAIGRAVAFEQWREAAFMVKMNEEVSGRVISKFDKLPEDSKND